MTSLLLGAVTISSSLIGIGGGSSPFMGAELSLPGVKGDFGVLSPECKVRGDIGGLSLLVSPLPLGPCVGVCLDFNPSGLLPIVMGEIALSELEPPEVVAPPRSRVHVKISKLTSVCRRTFPPAHDKVSQKGVNNDLIPCTSRLTVAYALSAKTHLVATPNHS